MAFPSKVLGRFESKIHHEPMSGCHIWGAAATADGHGIFTAEGRRYMAHRFSYLAYVGEIPEGLVVRHRCNTPPCVNPRHLITGTLKDNTWDMLEAGRHVGKTGGVKLSHDKADAIRSMVEDGITHAAAAELFGVTRQSVRAIIIGKTWKR